MLFDCKKLDKSVPIPLYFQLKELVLNEIKKGNYKEGDADRPCLYRPDIRPES